MPDGNSERDIWNVIFLNSEMTEGGSGDSIPYEFDGP